MADGLALTSPEFTATIAAVAQINSREKSDAFGATSSLTTFDEKQIFDSCRARASKRFAAEFRICIDRPLFCDLEVNRL
jgi:hypothetical protein